MSDFQLPENGSTSLQTQKRANLQHRLGGYALDLTLFMCSLITLGLAYLIWNLVVWGQGQTPAKQILRMRVYSLTTGKPVTWGHMAVRQLLIPLTYSLTLIPFFFMALSIAADGSDYSTGGMIGLGQIMYFALLLLDILWIFNGQARQRLTDAWAKTYVVNEA
jgi:uncharacterized RDD family membrane protein YckC